MLSEGILHIHSPMSTGGNSTLGSSQTIKTDVQTTLPQNTPEPAPCTSQGALWPAFFSTFCSSSSSGGGLAGGGGRSLCRRDRHCQLIPSAPASSMSPLLWMQQGPLRVLKLIWVEKFSPNSTELSNDCCLSFSSGHQSVHTGLTQIQTSISTALHRGVSNELIGRKGLWLNETDTRGTFYSGKL